MYGGGVRVSWLAHTALALTVEGMAGWGRTRLPGDAAWYATSDWYTFAPAGVYGVRPGLTLSTHGGVLPQLAVQRDGSFLFPGVAQHLRVSTAAQLARDPARPPARVGPLANLTVAGGLGAASSEGCWGCEEGPPPKAWRTGGVISVTPAVSSQCNTLGVSILP